ncbi:hypothetical protein BU15DRAFT_34529, partial [Melanogaster broomeanus]
SCAYACTDYCAQGQTLTAVVINIGTPPTGGLSLFTAVCKNDDSSCHFEKEDKINN